MCLLSASARQVRGGGPAWREAAAPTHLASGCPLQVITPLDSARHKTVPINDTSRPLTVDTPIFTGTASLLLRNLPATPPAVFAGKRRQMMLAVQVGAAAVDRAVDNVRLPPALSGKCNRKRWPLPPALCPGGSVLRVLLCLLPQGCFKQPDITLESLVLGSDFARPLKLPAAPLISHAITWLAHKLGGGVSVNVTGQQPFILAPLIAAAQVVNVAPRGQEPDLLAPVEDLRLFDAGLVNTWTGALVTHAVRHTGCAWRHDAPGHQDQLFFQPQR